MSNDVILEATVDFIMENEKHLNLAFRVAEAVPRVREKLLRKVLDGIKGHFLVGDWEILTPYDKNIGASNARLLLRGNDWPKSANDDETGIQLITEGSYWSDVFIGLRLSEKLRKKIEGQPELKKKLNKLKTCEDPKWPLRWEYLRSDLRDWRGEKFLERALQSPEQIVGEVTDQLKAWQNRKEAREILTVARCSHGQ